VDAALAAWAADAVARVDGALGARFGNAWPPRLQEALRYPISTGGKRLRPLLCLAAAEAVSARPAGAAQVGAAIAVELVHTYSLVHDDLPAMDDDALRRGQPTVHVVYGEGPAILVGDALLTEAFAVLAALELPAPVVVALVAELAGASGGAGMIAGQAADIGLGGPVEDLDSLLRLHGAKTGALIRASARMGALAGGADPGELARLSRYGEAVGLAFQLADDVLDADQDEGPDGPPSVLRLLGPAQTLARARSLVDEAVQAVAPLPRPAPLQALARWAVDRDH
jgi:geranylgeranyl diphosphate synthase, type II